MAQWVRTLAAETADLSLIPVTDSFKLPSDLHMHTIHAHTHVRVQTHTQYHFFKKSVVWPLSLLLSCSRLSSCLQ